MKQTSQNPKDTPMIDWKFKCLDCGYRFTATELRKSYETYTECAMCGSKNFEKKVINEKCNL